MKARKSQILNAYHGNPQQGSVHSTKVQPCLSLAVLLLVFGAAQSLQAQSCPTHGSQPAERELLV